jgi:hypothetical protein
MQQELVQLTLVVEVVEDQEQVNHVVDNQEPAVRES